MKYKDRQGTEYDITTSQDRFLRHLYGGKIGRFFLSFFVSPRMTNLIGRFMNSRLSRFKIRPFIRKNAIDMSEYEEVSYRSYNDFFTRKIRPGARTVDPDQDVLISPCDGKLSAYRVTPGMVINIKGSDYSLKSLLIDTELAEQFAGGVCYIIRLTVDNYHRYCYPVSGSKTDNYYIPGIFHTVNPVAMEHTNVYYQNSREFTMIESEDFGFVVQMEVGALGVGRITNLMGEGECVRGEEKGYFEFGGSTIVLLLDEGAVMPDPDLLANTAEGFETIVKYGEHIGRR